MKPITSFFGSFRFAFQGIATAFREGRNIRVQALIALLACILGFCFRIDPLSWIALLLCIGAVLSAECVNTALEDLVDLVSPQYHPLAKSVKDMAAGAVLILSLVSCAVGIIIFGTALMPFLGI
ncbi:MAG: diacylglycerol kinase family protein [Raoultibacter sp.]